MIAVPSASLLLVQQGAMQRYLRSLPADTLGISASGLHGALRAYSLTPRTGAGLAHYVPGDEIAHRSLAALVLSAGALALVRGYRVHRKRIVLLGFAAGSMLVLAGATAGRLLGFASG